MAHVQIQSQSDFCFQKMYVLVGSRTPCANRTHDTCGQRSQGISFVVDCAQQQFAGSKEKWLGAVMDLGGVQQGEEHRGSLQHGNFSESYAGFWLRAVAEHRCLPTKKLQDNLRCSGWKAESPGRVCPTLHDQSD